LNPCNRRIARIRVLIPADSRPVGTRQDVCVRPALFYFRISPRPFAAAALRASGAEGREVRLSGLPAGGAGASRRRLRGGALRTASGVGFRFLLGGSLILPDGCGPCREDGPNRRSEEASCVEFEDF